MPRTLLNKLTLACLLISILSLAAVCTHTGFLGEMIPWPAMSAALSVVELALADQPSENITGLEAWGTADEMAFGLLPVGTGTDPGVSFVLFPGEPPRLIIDTDNDEDLADETGCYDIERSDARSYGWFVTVSVEYEENGATHCAPYHVLIQALYLYSSGSYIYGYSGWCQRSGLIELEGELYPISITSQLSNGVYSNISQLVVVVDTDGDGELNDLPGSHEVFRPGEPIQVGTSVYRISFVSDDGRSIAVEAIGTASPRPVIARGEPAPDFQSRTVTGDPFALSDFRGDVVVLLFLPDLSPTDCATCFSPSPSPWVSRLTDIWQALDWINEGMQMVVVTESPLSSEQLPLTEERISYVYDPDVVRLYRRSYGALVIDQQGIIRAMDEAWSKFVGVRPSGKLDELDAIEILWVVERLFEGGR